MREMGPRERRPTGISEQGNAEGEKVKPREKGMRA